MSFQQGVSGLNAASRNLDVIGNNVANSGTVGAKASRAEFADVYARVATGNNIGLGVQLSEVAQQFAQGTVSTTDNPLDIAINGNGFFQLKDANGSLMYSRNGQFQVDRSGYIVTAQGAKLMGHPYVPQGGQVPGEPTALQLPTIGIQPSATANVKLEINLDARAVKSLPASGPMIDLNDDQTYNSSTSLTLYDAKGLQVSVSWYMQKTDADTWNVYATANGEVLNPDSAGMPQPITTLSFSPDGRTLTSPASPFIFDIPATGAGSAVATQPLTGVKLDISRMTQFGSVFGPTDVAQDGFPPGQLTAVTVEDDGMLRASYSSGQSSPIGRIDLATFRNQQGLKPLGGNTWQATYESGDPVLGEPGGGNRGVLQGQSVEESNIDLTGELVNMMVAQRVYQANAQTIKTQDSVLQTLVNLR